VDVETLVFVHARLAQTVLLYTLVMGLWTGWKFFRSSELDGSYWGALVIGEVLMIGQGVMGGLMVVTGLRPAEQLHFLYGFLVALAWPSVYLYTNGRAGRREALIYALVSFAIFGLAWRAITTG
jgi:hypothetical protein